MRKLSVRLIGSSILLLSVAAVLSAQAAKKPAGKPPLPPHVAAAAHSTAATTAGHELASLRWMIGTWQCTGKTMASAMGPEHPTEARVESSMALNNMWIVHRYREKKTAQNPTPIAADEYWTYDPAGKIWDRVAVDNGGGWAASTARGWEKGILTWTGEGKMGGQKTKFRDTFTQKGETEIAYTGEIGSSDGKWSKIWDLGCKK